MTSLPDLSDQHFEQIQIGKLALQAYGSMHSIAGEIYTVSCSDDTSVVKDILSREGKNKIEPIKSMPGVNRYSIDRLSYVIEKACNLKIPLVALFPYTPDNKKNNYGTPRNWKS